jgi:hypothetical protein
VLPSCRDCGWARSSNDVSRSSRIQCGKHEVNGREAPRAIDRHMTSAPPAWCPLRGAR